jgi:hypothetical protein
MPTVEQTDHFLIDAVASGYYWGFCNGIFGY